MMSQARLVRTVAASILLALAGIPVALAQSSATGWVVVSMSQDNGMTSVGLVMRSLADPGEKHEVGFTLSLLAGDQHEWGENHAGVVRAVRLPAGAYRLANFLLVHGATNRRWSQRQDFAIHFEVKANEVTYLGEFLGTGTLGAPFLGYRAVEKPYFLVRDQQARDLPIAEKDQSEMRGLAVRNVAPLKPAKGPSVFRTTRVPEAK